MSCTSFLKQVACICTETAAVDCAVSKQLDSAQQIAADLTPAHKVLIKKQVKKELAKAKPASPMPTDELHEHLDALHKAITGGHNEVHPVVVEHIFKPPEAPTQAADPAAVPAKP